MNACLNLFDGVRQLECIPVPDADLRFMHGFYDAARSRRAMAALLAETPWRQEKIRLWGKEYLQPRLTCWYGDFGADYVYSGLKLDPLPWTTALSVIRRDVETATGFHFNSVLLNLYRDQNDSVSWHSDDERELGAEPAIASLSFGETRVFRMKHRKRTARKTLSIELTDGSLLLMAGATQRCWMHVVEKERAAKGVRINLTFRRIDAAALRRHVDR